MKEIFNKLIIIEDGSDNHIVMFDGDQIAIEDLPGTMIFDIDDEALVENAEMDQEKIDFIRNNYYIFAKFISDNGFKIVNTLEF